MSRLCLGRVWLGRFTKQIVECFIEVGAVGETILSREHDQPQLGHRAALRLQIDRFNIEQRLTKRNDEQVPALHVRTLLIPERELPGELRVLIDPSFDLQRSINQT